MRVMHRQQPDHTCRQHPRKPQKTPHAYATHECKQRHTAAACSQGRQMQVERSQDKPRCRRSAGIMQAQQQARARNSRGSASHQVLRLRQRDMSMCGACAWCRGGPEVAICLVGCSSISITLLQVQSRPAQSTVGLIQQRPYVWWDHQKYGPRQ